MIRKIFPWVVCILLAFLVLGFVCFYKASDESNNQVSDKRASREKITEQELQIKKDLRELENFRKDILAGSEVLQDLNNKEKIIRVFNVYDDFWVVETDVSNVQRYAGYVEPSEEHKIRALGYSRNIYAFQNDQLNEIRKDAICIVTQRRFVRDDLIVLSGPCGNNYFFVSAHKYQTGEKIRFSDSRGLSKGVQLGAYYEGSLVSKDGTVNGYLLPGEYGDDPVIVVDMIRWWELEPFSLDTANGSRGIAIFSLNSGNLVEFIDYSSY
jgi:hypothetical protein